jgi:hypothetical protein
MRLYLSFRSTEQVDSTACRFAISLRLRQSIHAIGSPAAFEMAAVAPGIVSNLLAHGLSDCVDLDCPGGVSPGQASATAPSGAVHSDLARFLFGDLCVRAAHILACSRRAGSRVLRNARSPHARCRLQCWLVHWRHGRVIVELRVP